VFLAEGLELVVVLLEGMVGAAAVKVIGLLATRLGATNRSPFLPTVGAFQP